MPLMVSLSNHEGSAVVIGARPLQFRILEL
jgi:hypothetical protein